MNLISVIIPVYNAAKYIERTVSSILNQNFDGVEIVLIDDGSTDDTAVILKKIKKYNAGIVVISQKNSGVSAARNAGLKQASGKYIMFVDADDYLPCDALKNLFVAIEQTNSDICFGKTKVIDLNKKNESVFEKNIGDPNSKNKETNIFEENSSTNFIKEMFMESSSFDLHSSCAKLYKHSIINEILFDEGRSSNEDRYFLFKALCHSSKCVGINNIVYLYEKHENSLSTKEIDERIFDNIYFCEKMDKTINNDFPKLAYYSKYNMIITYLKVYRVIYRSDSKIIKKYKNELKKIKKYIVNNYKSVSLPITKKIEIIILDKFNLLYKPLLYIYDLGR